MFDGSECRRSAGCAEGVYWIGAIEYTRESTGDAGGMGWTADYATRQAREAVYRCSAEHGESILGVVDGAKKIVWLRRAALSLLWRGDGVAEICRGAAFADVVAIPSGDLDGYIAGYDRLASQARMEGEAGGLIEAVELVFVGGVWTQVRVTLLDDDVTGSAGAAPSAGVFDMHAEVDCDI
jgi:hypothetical protein